MKKKIEKIGKFEGPVISRKKNLLKLSLRKLKTLDSLSQIKMDKNF